MVLLVILVAAACGGSDDDTSGDAQPAPVDRETICQINADLLVNAVDQLPDQVDEAAMLDVAGIHRENSDNMFVNDCDLQVIDQVDAALCTYLSSTPTAATTNQGVVDATAAIYCDDPSETVAPSTTVRPDATTTTPPDAPISGEDEVCAGIEDDFLTVIETVGGLVEDDDVALLESLGFDLADICGGGSDAFCEDVAGLLPLVETNAAEVQAASGCP
jgi:hypothetical protein